MKSRGQAEIFLCLVIFFSHDCVSPACRLLYLLLGSSVFFSLFFSFEWKNNIYFFVFSGNRNFKEEYRHRDMQRNLLNFSKTSSFFGPFHLCSRFLWTCLLCLFAQLLACTREKEWMKETKIVDYKKYVECDVFFCR